VALARRRIWVWGLVPAVVLGGLGVYAVGDRLWVPVYLKMKGKRTVADVMYEYGPSARDRLRAPFESRGAPFPPQRIALVAIKDARRLELYAGNDGAWTFVRDYKILGASGGAGPKLREGDRQVPEGIYGIEGLNPNSAHHVSLKVDYPNAFDRAMAARDRRSNLGGDIFIHGSSTSIGCLAMEDDIAEELFVLAADVGIEQIRVMIVPCDMRKQQPTHPPGAPGWLPELYAQLKQELRQFHRATDTMP